MTPSRRRDMSPEAFREAAERATRWIETYRDEVDELPVLSRVRPGEIAARLPEAPPAEGESFERILADVDDVVVPGLTHWNHPGFLAYFASSASAPGILAEYLGAAVNQNAMLWRTSPAGTELEERMVEWVRRFVGLPDGFRGVLQDTASASSFTALLAARQALDPDARTRGLAGRPDAPAPTVYVSEQAHSSLEKAAIAAGIGTANVRRIPVDGRFRMRPDALAEAVEEDVAAGRRPVMVGATVGTTSTASVDPVEAAAEVCAEHGAWLHVDAAYAGPAASLPEERGRFAGWERADSVVLNPHKWMATPLDCSVLLFRDPEPFRASLALTPAYLSSEETATDLMDYGLSLGRRFRSLKLWFLFRWHGAEGLRSMLRTHIEWAEAFADSVRDDGAFELAAPPSFSTVCFRARAPDGRDPDAFNERLLREVNRRGEVFLSHTELEGRFTLRLSVGGVHTRREDVRRAWRLLAATRDRLAEEPVGDPVDEGRGEP